MTKLGYRIVACVREKLYKGLEPDINGNYLFSSEEIAQELNETVDIINRFSETVVYYLKKDYDLSVYGKYPEYKGQSIFTDISFKDGLLQFKKNPLLNNPKLESLWALKPSVNPETKDIFDENHQRIKVDEDELEKKNMEDLALKEAMNKAEREAKEAERIAKMNQLTDTQKEILESYEFNKRGKLFKAVIKRGVKVIPNKAFYECHFLKEVLIPEGVIEIEGGAFEDCTHLKIVKIPDTIKEIGYNAFKYCSSLEQIILPEGLLEIYGDVFYGCKSLKTVLCSSHLIKVESGAFQHTHIRREDLPADIPYVESGAFKDKSSGLISIHMEYFGPKKEIKPVEPKITVEQKNLLQDYRYNEIRGDLTNITVKDNIRYIPAKAFKELNFLSTVKLPQNLRKISAQAFLEDTFLKNINLPDTVTDIDDLAFMGCSMIKNLKLPQNLQSIGMGTFEGCSGLLNLTLPKKLLRIKMRAFKDCYRMEKLTISDSIVSLGEDVFRGCSSLRCIYISSNCQIKEALKREADKLGHLCTIVEDGYYGIPKEWKDVFASYEVDQNGNLLFAEVKEGITEIPNRLFEGCTTLKKISLPQTLEQIGIRAFAECKNLIQMVIPVSVKTIGIEAFKNCSSLRNIKIFEGVEEIGNEAFAGCSKLNKISLPNSIKRLGSNVFLDCTSMTVLKLPQSYYNSSGQVIFHCPKLKEVSWPMGCEVKDDVFAELTQLKKITVLNYKNNKEYIDKLKTKVKKYCPEAIIFVISEDVYSKSVKLPKKVN